MMSLWDWAVAAYAQPGARSACLALQDDSGQCVSYLLWAIWAGDSADLTPATCAKAAQAAREAEAAILRPLRARRRAAKTGPAPDAGLHTRLQAEELQAERRLLERLEALTVPAAAPPLAPAEALSLAVRAWGVPAAPDALDQLARAFPKP